MRMNVLSKGLVAMDPHVVQDMMVKQYAVVLVDSLESTVKQTLMSVKLGKDHVPGISQHVTIQWVHIYAYAIMDILVSY